jgi:hypothetical protein
MWIRLKLKSRIRIKVKSSIRICIKRVWILNSALQYSKIFMTFINTPTHSIVDPYSIC